MPALIDESTGRAASLTVGETAWHKLGVNFPAGTILTIPEAIEAAVLNWTVEPRRVAVEMVAPDGGTYWKPTGEYKGMIRNDTDDLLGVVGKYYTPLQNTDAFRVFEPMMSEGLATIETAGALRAGRDVYVGVRFDVTRMSEAAQETFAREGIEPFGVLLNNHAGQRRVVLGRTDVRVVCANTAQMFLSRVNNDNGVAVRHTSSVEAKVAASATALWANLLKHYDRVATLYRALRATYLDEALFRRLVLDAVAKEPKKAHEGLDDLGERALRAIERRNVVSRLWVEGRGHTGDHSAFEAWNAVTEAVDHSDAFRPPRSSRTASLLDGNLSNIKTAVWQNLTGYAADRAELAEEAA